MEAEPSQHESLNGAKSPSTTLKTNKQDLNASPVTIDNFWSFNLLTMKWVISTDD